MEENKSLDKNEQLKIQLADGVKRDIQTDYEYLNKYEKFEMANENDGVEVTPKIQSGLDRLKKIKNWEKAIPTGKTIELLLLFMQDLEKRIEVLENGKKNEYMANSGQTLAY